jgi:uncharacterized protein (TIGR00730 family)
VKRLCVFCASSYGNRPVYMQAAQEIGRTLAQRGIGVVYGGGNVGLMGVVADAALEAGGEVIGVIPKALADVEIAHAGLTQLHIVGSMHERKALMADLSDGFIALPGGFGTLEEFAEVLTWSQLGLHQKPCGLLNVAGYYDSLIAFFNHAIEEKLLKPENRSLVLDSHDCEDLLNQLKTFQPRAVPKWISKDET